MGRTTRRRSTIACIRGYLETLEIRRLLHQESILPAAVKPAADVSYEKADEARGGQVRIVGGDETVDGRWPWMASLQRGSHFCGASLIAPDAVLTAAHCVEGENPADLSVVLGRHDLASTVGEVHRIADIRVHPAYNPLTNDADLAVLLLKTASERPPIPVLTSENASLAQPGTQSVVIGWGKDDFGNLPDRMREVTVPIVSNETANRPQSYGGSVTDNMLAAGLEEGGKDSCQGDSGGPLMVKDGLDHYVQAGIVSWGDGCAIPMKFGLYTRVSVFADWIHQQYQLSSAGVVGITAERLSEQGTAEIVLEDADLTKLPEIKVQLSSDHGDRETVVLRATTPGRFRGGIALVPGDAVIGNGVLEVRPGGVIQATYEDEDNGLGQVATAVDSSQVVADDYGDSAEQAAIVTVPASIQGEIELAGDEDWLRFPVESGKTYRVETLLDGSLNDSVLSVYAANGQTLIVEDDDGGVGYASSVTVSAGEYEALFAKVAGFGSNVGTYKLNIVEYLPPADDHGDSAETATLVEIPNRVSGELADGNDRDWFAFQAVAGQEYLLITELGTLFDSTLRLLDSDGVTELATNDDGGFGLSSRIRWTAPSDGVRYLEVRGHERHTGTYSVEIAPYLPLPDDHGNAFGEATSVAVPSTTSGEIEGRDDRDWFSFTAIAGAHYTLQVKLDTLWDSEMWLYAPDGQTELEYSDDDSGLASLIHWTATEDGTFYALVQGYDGFEVGKYSLEIRVEEEPVDPEDDYPDRPVGAPVLSLPTTTQAAINYARDEDWFALSATAGVIYRFEVQLTTLFDSLLTLYAANGQTIVGVDDDGGDELGSLLLWTAPATATYFVVVSGFDRLQGGYKLLVNVEPPLDDFPNQAPGVTLSVPSQTPGTIGEVGDSDWFAFSATGDTTYVIETNVIVPGNATMELGDSQLKLMDQDGVNMLEFDDDGGVGNASLIRWTAPATGQYHIVVTGYNLHTGAYRLNLSVDETQNPTEDDHADKQEDATPVPVSAVVGGYDETEGRVARLDAGGDVDWFSFEATAGIAYRIDARLRGLGDSLLRLTDSSGRILAANDDVAGTLGSRIFWTATATERYFVEVSSLNPADEGEYDLLVTVPYGDANLDGVFDSMDLVKLFQLGEFEDGVAENSTWASGDWNGDREFSTRDLVLAFQAGLYASNSFNGVPNRHTLERTWAAWDDERFQKDK